MRSRLRIALCFVRKPHALSCAPTGFDAVPALPRSMPRLTGIRQTTWDFTLGPPQPGQQGGGFQQMLASLLGGMGGAAGAAGMPGAPAAGGAAGAAAGQAAGAAGQQPAVRLHVGPPGQAVPVAIPLFPVGGAAGQRGQPGAPGQQQQQQGAASGTGAPPAAGQAAPQPAGMSPELSNMARLLMAQLGVGPAEQQQLLGQFGGMMAALRSSSGGLQAWWATAMGLPLGMDRKGCCAYVPACPCIPIHRPLPRLRPPSPALQSPR